MSEYEAPAEIRELEKLINSFASKKAKSHIQVLDDLLTYIIHGYSPHEGPLDRWEYEQDDNAIFYQMYSVWAQIMLHMIDKHGWYDAFGDLYMASASKLTQQCNGQFFTPESICNFMSESISGRPDNKAIGLRISDPTCGSGRNLLAFHAKHVGNYLFGEDINRTCCLMTVCNFLVHGCVGEVIWHDSLDPESYNDGWVVNGILTKTGVPTIRRIKKEESFVWNSWQYLKMESLQNNEKVKAEIKPEKNITPEPVQVPSIKDLQSGKGEHIQLTLFDF